MLLLDCLTYLTRQCTSSLGKIKMSHLHILAFRKQSLLSSQGLKALQWCDGAGITLFKLLWAWRGRKYFKY